MLKMILLIIEFNDWKEAINILSHPSANGIQLIGRRSSSITKKSVILASRV